MQQRLKALLAMAGATSLSSGFLAMPAQAAGDVILHSFTGGSDGAYPVAGLTNLNGVLYSTTPGNSGSYGTAFQITTDGTESVVHEFGGATQDGAAPTAGLLAIGNMFYGTTSAGGAYNAGSVFSMTPDGVVKVLHSFGESATDGTSPASTLVAVNGVLYGTTTYGGAYSRGTVFSITTAGEKKNLHSFGNGADGAEPTSGLIYANGKLYGATEHGGTTTGVGCFGLGCGTVFTITPAGAYKRVHTFVGGASDGAWPYGPLQSVGKNVYGTTLNAGTSNWGTVYKITSGGTESLIHSFAGSADGANPVGGLMALNGVLYGTTSYLGPNGGGTVFKMSTTGAQTVLYSFGASQTDGNAPNSSLIYLNGQLYGTTMSGGTDNLGTVFSVAK